MSTQSYTPNHQAPYEQDPYEQDPYQQASYQPTRPRKGGPSWFRIWSIAIGTVAAGALVALAAIMAHSHTTTSQTPATSTPTTSTSAPAQPAANPAVPAQPTGGPTTNPVTPSASVKKLQQQLGQLNYYEGTDDGIMGPQTIAAIKDLQRQAGLPQTGQMNAATQTALNNYLTHGNNQMAG
jgi:hypothetical protein